MTSSDETQNLSTMDKGILNIDDEAEKTNYLSKQILDAAIEVHRTLGGPGLLESLYEEALIHELRIRNIPVQSQVSIPVVYKSCKLRDPLRLDILVDNKIIIEVKAAEIILPVYKSQILTYLRLSSLKLGVLINFGQVRLIDGWHRIVNDF